MSTNVPCPHHSCCATKPPACFRSPGLCPALHTSPTRTGDFRGHLVPGAALPKINLSWRRNGNTSTLQALLRLLRDIRAELGQENLLQEGSARAPRPHLPPRTACTPTHPSRTHPQRICPQILPAEAAPTHGGDSQPCPHGRGLQIRADLEQVSRVSSVEWGEGWCQQGCEPRTLCSSGRLAPCHHPEGKLLRLPRAETRAGGSPCHRQNRCHLLLRDRGTARSRRCSRLRV